MADIPDVRCLKSKVECYKQHGLSETEAINVVFEKLRDEKSEEIVAP